MLGIGAAFDAGKSAIEGLIGPAIEAQQVASQTAAVLKSTGEAAGLSIDDISGLAGSLSKLTPFEDEAIQSAENLLLTFTNIGKDIFPDATETVLNMSQALGQDLKSSSVQLGKALNDPIKGITALSRVGVSFTEEQKDQIKTLQESGDMMGAQKVILGELEKEFGGAAKAAGQTFGGQMVILQTAVGNVMEAIGGPLIKVLSGAAVAILPFVQSFADDLPAAIDSFMGSLSGVGDVLATLQPWIVRAQDAWGTLVSVFAGDWSPSDEIDPLVNQIGQLGMILRDQVIPPVMQFAGFLANNWQPILASVGVLIAGPVLGALGGLAAAGLAAAGAFAIAAAPVVLLAGAFILLKNAWDSNLGDIQGKLGDLTDLFTEDFGALAEIVKQAMTGDISGAFENFTGLLGFFTSDLSEILSGWGAEFLAWLEPIASPLLAQAQVMGGQLVGWVAEQAPVLLNQLLLWGQQFVDWVAPQIPPLLTELQALGTQSLTWVQQQAAPLLESLTAWGIQFVEWVQPQIPPLLAELGALGMRLIGWVQGQLPGILAQLTQWGTQFMAWVGPAIPPLLAEAGKLVGELWQWIRAEGPGIARELASWATEMAAWVITAIPPLLLELGKLLFQIGDWIVHTGAPEVLGFAFDMGAAIVTGIIDGIGNYWGKLTSFLSDKLAHLGQVDAPAAIEAGSPSRMFARLVGEPIAQGIAQGVLQGGGVVNDAMAIIINAAIRHGIDPLIALALAKAESNFNPAAVGDNGASVGLFQLHERGQGAGMSKEQRSDPNINAEKFLGAHKALFDQLVAEGLAGEDLARTFGRLAEGSDPQFANRYAEAYRQLAIETAGQDWHAKALMSTTQQFIAVQKQGTDWAKVFADQQAALSQVLAGQAPAMRPTVDAMTAFGQVLGPIERQVAGGAISMDTLQFKLVDLARATGLATKPWDDYSAGLIDINEAMMRVVSQSSDAGPQFDALRQALGTTNTITDKGALDFLQLAINMGKVPDAAAAATSAFTGVGSQLSGKIGPGSDLVNNLAGSFDSAKVSIDLAKDSLRDYTNYLFELVPERQQEQVKAWDLVRDSINGAAGALQAYRSQLGSGGEGGGIPSFASGGVMPYDGLAFVHKGEHIGYPGQGGSGGSGGGGGDTYITVNVPGLIGSPLQVAEAIDSLLARRKGSNGRLGFEN